MINKTRILPLCFQGLDNPLMLLGWVIEAIVVAFVGYCRPINLALNTRNVVFLHIGFYGVFLIVGALVFDELRKLLIRRWPAPAGRGNFFVRNTLT